ncbi:MAG: hypothetical protein ACE5H3_00850 [Planctomycetota bacterium]
MGLDILLVRMDRESPRKCSLTPLRRRENLPLRWISFSAGDRISVGRATLLHPEGDLLQAADAGRPLLLVDSSWRDLPRVLRGLEGELHLRRLPASLRTVYPRRSKTFPDPARGLASIEALHAATALLGARDDSLLDGHPWREEWLERNHALLQP